MGILDVPGASWNQLPLFHASRYVKEGDSAASVTSNLQAIAADAQAAHGVMVLPRGTLTYNGTIATLTDRCGIIGYGKRHTRLVPTSGFTGDAIAVNDCWRNNTEDSFTATTSGAVGTNKSGVVLRGFSIQGDRATQARGLIFYGRNDDVLLDDIGLYYLNGKALGIGGEDAYGLMRESLIRNVRVQGCGNATDAAVQLTVGATVGDITNHIAFDNCQFVYPFGVGLHILNPRTAAMRRITFDNLMLHGQYTGATVGADVMVVEGDVEDLSGYIKTNGSVNIGGTPYAAIRFKANATSGLRPSLVDLKVAMRSMNGDGIVIDGADAITLTGMSQPSTIAGSEVKFSANSTVRAQVDIIANSARSFSIDSTVTDKVFGRADTLDVDKVATLGLVNRSSDPAQLDNTVQWYAKSGAPYFRAPNPDGTVSNVLLSREVRRSTDSALAVSSTALVADSTLSLNIRSGAVYEVVAHVIADGPQTADLSIGFTASTAPTMDWTVDPGLATNITSASGSVLAPAKAWGDTITVGLAGVGTKTVTRIVGRVVGGGAAGTIVPLSIQFAQGTSDPGQVTIRTGSFMWLRRVS